MFDIPIPPLQTLAQQPSWQNRAGRTDRSACCEFSVRDARRRAVGFVAANTGCKHNITIAALDLHQLHSARNPFVLQGDRRTGKSNVMKPPRKQPRHDLQINSNAGACRTKILGVPHHWSQTITLLGPNTQQRTQAARNSHHTPTPTANHWFMLCPVCSARVRTLFLPLCTEAEACDAALAHTWLTHYEAHIRPHMTRMHALRTQIIDRYATLFHPRTLACRKCLHLRYGEAKRSQHVSKSPHQPRVATRGKERQPAKPHHQPRVATRGKGRQPAKPNQ